MLCSEAISTRLLRRTNSSSWSTKDLRSPAAARCCTMDTAAFVPLVGEDVEGGRGNKQHKVKRMKTPNRNLEREGRPGRDGPFSLLAICCTAGKRYGGGRYAGRYLVTRDTPAR